MPDLTWRQLAEAIHKMDEDHLDDNATIYIDYEDEFHPVDCKMTLVEPESDASSILDVGASFLTIKDP